jgi:hypothetical protein
MLVLWFDALTFYNIGFATFTPGPEKSNMSTDRMQKDMNPVTKCNSHVTQLFRKHNKLALHNYQMIKFNSG